MRTAAAICGALHNLADRADAQLRWLAGWLAPGLRLWPWLLADVVFGAYLTQSPQALSQLDELASRPTQLLWLLPGLALAEGLMLAACLFTSLVLNVHGTTPTDGDVGKGLVSLVATTTERSDGRMTGGRYLLWSLLLAVAPGFLLAYASGSLCVALTAAAVAVLSALSINWTLRGAWTEPPSWIARMQGLHHRRYFLAAFVWLLAVLPLWLGSKLFTDNPDLPRVVGSTVVQLLGLASVSTLFGVMFVTIPRCLRWPWMGRAAAVLLIGWNLSGQPLVDQENQLLTAEREAASKHVAWAAEQNKCKHAPPGTEALRDTATSDQSRDAVDMYLVSAEGGGIRAAYWTGVGLAQMDLATQSDFGNRVRLMSGVSGGSIGIAAWLAARETPRLSPEARLTLVSDYLSTDFLAPAVAGLLFLDAPRLIFGMNWSSVRRDDLFEAALIRRWKAFSDSDFLLRPLRRLCYLELKVPPAVYFNSTEVVGGMQAAVGNVRTSLPGGAHRYLNEALAFSSLGNMTVAQAAVMSARFPLLSPAADIGISRKVLKGYMERSANVLRFERERLSGSRTDWLKPVGPASRPDQGKELCGKGIECDRMGVLVDGGYFDNSGLYTVRQELNRLVDSNASAMEPYKPRIGVVHFSNSQAGLCTHADDWRNRLSAGLAKLVDETKFEPACDYELLELEATQTKRTFQWLTSPIETILSVRDGHAYAEKQDMRSLISRHLPGGAFVDIALKDVLSSAYCSELPLQGYKLACERRRAAEVKILSTPLFSGEGQQLKGYGTDLRKALGAEIDRCKPPFKKEYPPLGWMLREVDAEQLRCLAASGAFNALVSREQRPRPN